MKTFVFVSRTFRLALRVPGVVLLAGLTVHDVIAAIPGGGPDRPVFGAIPIGALLLLCVYTSLVEPERADVAEDGTVTLHSLVRHRAVPAERIALVLLSGVSRWSLFRRVGAMVFLRAVALPIALQSRAAPLHGFLCAVLEHNPDLDLRVSGDWWRSRGGKAEVLERLREIAGGKP